MIGRTVKHYRIASELGRGGMGEVYLARDTHLDRDVALKFLPPHLSEDTEAKKRFIHEAKAASSLDHPNICTIYDVAETDDGQLFIAMAYYGGRTLKERLEEGPLTLDEAIGIARQVASALSRAHAANIVHRDVKPANIMVTGDGLVKLLDFGVAKLAGATVLTKEGSTVGTVQYMSPEQARGEPVDARADVWSLGAVLYEMVAGQRPFTGEYDQAVVYSILNADPESVRALRPDIPTAVERVIERALEKNPDRRYQDAGELFVELDALGRGATGAVPASKGIWLSRRQRKLLVRVASVTAAVVVVALGYVFLNRPSEAATVTVAVLPLTGDAGEADTEWFTDGMTDGMITELAQMDNLRVIARNSVMRYKGTDKSLSQIASELNATYLVDGSVTRQGDTVTITARLAEARTDQYVWSDRIESDFADVLDAQARIAGAVAREIHGDLSPGDEAQLATARRINPQIYEAYLRGMYHIKKLTPDDIAKGLAYLHEAVELDPADPYAWTGLAEGYITMGHSPNALTESWPRAREAAETAVALDSTLAEARSASGIVKMYYLWDWKGAEAELVRANALNPSLALNHYHYSWYLVMVGRLEEALSEHILAEELDPLSGPLVAWTGEVYRCLGRYEEAHRQVQRALDLGDRSGTAELVQGRTYVDQGRWDEAILAHEAMVAKQPVWKANLGATYARAGRIDDARRIAVEIESSPITPIQANNLIILYAALGDADKAFEYLNFEPHHGWLPGKIRKGGVMRVFEDDPRFAQAVERMNMTGIAD